MSARPSLFVLASLAVLASCSTGGETETALPAADVVATQAPAPAVAGPSAPTPHATTTRVSAPSALQPVAAAAVAERAAEQGSIASDVKWRAVGAPFVQPWSMAFLPDGRLLVTEKAGRLLLTNPATGARTAVRGVPAVAVQGQGGLADVVVHPDFSRNHLVYLSHPVKVGQAHTGVVVRARLELDATGGGGSLQDVREIWRQVPAATGGNHFALRLRFGPDQKLYISSGERAQFDPAQDPESNLGKIVRLNDDGSIPADNPQAAAGGVRAQIWASGLRNPLALDFAADGTLWEGEAGPRGGDEINRIRAGANYGWPLVSEGSQYDGEAIPRHASRRDLLAPAIHWTPVITPGDMIIYRGKLFSELTGQAVVAGLSDRSLVRVELRSDGTAREIERVKLDGFRIRSVEEGPDGAVWVLEDGPQGRLLKVTP